MSYHLQIVNKVSSDLPLHISIKPNALSLVKVVVKSTEVCRLFSFRFCENMSELLVLSSIILTVWSALVISSAVST